MDLARLASANLRGTYLDLAMAIPGTELIEDDGFIACRGPFDFAVCNFATALRLDPWSARRLRELAAVRSVFQVYGLPDDTPAHRGELMERQGFRVSYRMVMMAFEGVSVRPGLELAEATTLEQKLKVATFMGGQFFARQNARFRQIVATATASSERLQLFELLDRGQRIGGAMLRCEAESTGLYNLCVSPSRRGKGIGRSIVSWAMDYAAERRTPLILQCDSPLAPWYEYLGFRRIHSVDVYALSSMRHDDIMN